MPSTLKINEYETLIQLASKKNMVDNPSVVYSIAGKTLKDDVDWLNPKNLGYHSVKRTSNTSKEGSLDMSLWGEKYISKKGIKMQPMPTNEWWQPFVLPPGIGITHGINESPYLLAIVTKEKGEISPFGKKAGIEIYGPYTQIETSGGKDTLFSSGIRQLYRPKTFGFFMGVKLDDHGDFVVKHFVENHSPLSVTKVWDIQIYSLFKNKKINNLPNARIVSPIVRGSPFISMEFSAGNICMIESLLGDFNEGGKNGIAHIYNLGPKEEEEEDQGAMSCAAIQGRNIFTDLIEIHLFDKTKWILVFSKKINITCQVGSRSDVIRSSNRLEEKMILRIGLIDMCDHVDRNNYEKNKLIFPLIDSTCANIIAKNKSISRWKLMNFLKKHSAKGLRQLVDYMNTQGIGLQIFENLFVKNPLQDQFKEILKSKLYGDFELLTTTWSEENILNYLYDNSKPIDAIIVPEQFIDNIDNLRISDKLRNALVYDYTATRGKVFIGVGGISGNGSVKKLIKNLYNFDLNYAGKYEDKNNEYIGKIHKTNDLYSSPPFPNQEGCPKILHANNMPTEIIWPNATNIYDKIDTFSTNLNNYYYSTEKAKKLKKNKKQSQNSIELMTKGYHLYPLNIYCKPGWGGIDSCDSVATSFFYFGAGGLYWLGMDFSTDVLDVKSDWVKILMKAVWAGVCLGNHIGRSCDKLGRVLLIQNQPTQQNKTFLQDVAQEIFNRDGKIDYGLLKNYLQGVKQYDIGNVGDEPVILPNGQTETLRDFLLRHSLTMPIYGNLEIETSDKNTTQHEQRAQILYKFKVKSILPDGHKSHTLMPPTENENSENSENSENYLWDYKRNAVYVTPLHSKLEYRDFLYVVDNSRASSLEDDSTTCIATSRGKMCARSFGSRYFTECVERHKFNPAFKCIETDEKDNQINQMDEELISIYNNQYYNKINNETNDENHYNNNISPNRMLFGEHNNNENYENHENNYENNYENYAEKTKSNNTQKQ